VKCHDCNNIKDVIKIIPKRSHFFAFIDNEGFDAKWDTIDTLLSERNGDILITFPTTGFSRTDGFVSSKKSLSPEKANQTVIDFIKGDSWRDKTNEENLEQYEQDIKDLREIIIPIRIQRKIQKGYHYHLLYATKLTEGGSPWVPGIKDLKNHIEQLSGDDVKMILPVIATEQETIDKWLRGPQHSIYEYGDK
jgi:three-Cys-motif partner protein